MEPHSKRLAENAKYVLAMGIGLLMTSIMLLGFYLTKSVESEPLFFSVMFLAYALISLVMYGSIHRRAVKEELREYIDGRLSEVVAEIRILQETTKRQSAEP